jgi:UPF0755 protein
MKMRTSYILVAGVTLLLAGITLYFNSPPALMQEETFYVKDGEPVSHVAERLSKLNLVTSERFFSLLAWVGARDGIRKGKYRIQADSSAIEILSKFVRGDVLKHKVTFPEGFNMYMIAERLSKNEIVPGAEFLHYAADRAFLDSLRIGAPIAEGYLFPDTYIFAEESDVKDVIRAMSSRFVSVMDGIELASLKKLKLSLHELIVLASLVEKEARVPRERAHVAAVFHNRLRKGMKLDCDPTVRYAVKKFGSERITFADLAVNSPYNTYTVQGLPPTPICSPGRESILAALHPADTDYLFFVARNDGSHYFSKTLDEHNRAVDFYQKGLKNGFTDRQRLD